MTKETQDKIVSLRLSQDYIEAMDRLLERKKKEKPWYFLGRADIIREALYLLLKKEGEIDL